MDDPNPAVLFWGDEHVMIYNEPYTRLIKHQHKRGAMGRPALAALPEYKDHLIPIMAHIREKGEAVAHNNMLLFLERSGHLEETYLSLRYVPMLDLDGMVVGCYESIFDITRHVLSDRRLATLLQIGDHTSKAHTLEDFWLEATHALEHNAKDFPFALLYSVEARNSRSSSQSSSASSHSLTSDVFEYHHVRRWLAIRHVSSLFLLAWFFNGFRRRSTGWIGIHYHATMT